VIAMAERVTILLAEPQPDDAGPLTKCVAGLGFDFKLATTAEQTIEFLRHDVFQAAVIAVELTLRGEPLLRRISRLPVLECLVGIGPAGEAQWQVLAWRSGADAYVPRPATTQALATALRSLESDLVAGRQGH